MLSDISQHYRQPTLWLPKSLFKVLTVQNCTLNLLSCENCINHFIIFSMTQTLFFYDMFLLFLVFRVLMLLTLCLIVLRINIQKSSYKRNHHDWNGPTYILHFATLFKISINVTEIIIQNLKRLWKIFSIVSVQTYGQAKNKENLM